MPTDRPAWSRRAPRSHVRGASGSVQSILLMALSTAFMACMYAAIRKVPGQLHPFEVAFFRSLFALLLILAWHGRRVVALYRTRHLGLHILRGSLNVVAMLTFFYAVVITPLADVAALGFTAPLFASVLAIALLGEPPERPRLAVAALGFLGALIILRPGSGVVGVGHVLLLISSLFWSVTIMVIKLLARTESSLTITVYMGSVMAPLSLAAAAFFWRWPEPVQLLWLLLIAILGTCGQISLAQSLRSAEVTAVLPLDFLKLVWSALLGFLVFAEIPDFWTLIGGATIFGSTTYLAMAEAGRSRPGPGSAAGPRADIHGPAGDARGESPGPSRGSPDTR